MVTNVLLLKKLVTSYAIQLISVLTVTDLLKIHKCKTLPDYGSTLR